MAKRAYEDVFSDIAKKHKRMELNTLARVLLRASDDLSKKRRVTKTKLARALNIKRATVSNRIDILEEFDYIEQKGRTESGGGRMFLSIEDEKSVWEWDKQEEQMRKHEGLLVERIKTDSRIAALVNRKLIEKFVRLYTRAAYRKGLEQYSKIVEILDLRGIKENTKYVELKSSALSTALRFKGEKAIENIKEKKKTKESGERQDTKIDDKSKGKAGAAA